MDRTSGIGIDVDTRTAEPILLDDVLRRIDALLQRFDALTLLPVAEGELPGRPRPGALVIGGAAATVYWRARHVDLPLAQVRMVHALHCAQGQVLSARMLMEAAGIVVAANTVAAHIMAIRAAFRRVDPGFDAIRTERSRGYRWAEVDPQPGPTAL